MTHPSCYAIFFQNPPIWLLKSKRHIAPPRSTHARVHHEKETWRQKVSQGQRQYKQNNDKLKYELDEQELILLTEYTEWLT
jgi:hypothetical protein